jgi:SAM-dependent methyltransferase
MQNQKSKQHSDKAAQRGEPSYVWRAGQERRLDMLRRWGADQMNGIVLENGCGVGQYLERLAQKANLAVGIDIEFERLLEAKHKNPNLVCAVGEHLPFKRGQFDMILSNEVIEHVQDDRQAVAEMARVLAVGGRAQIFCPNRGYPFETHGIYWKGEYHFGNKLIVNYLPMKLRNKLAPHVRVYTARSLRGLIDCLPMKVVRCTVIFGAYDNIIQRRPVLGKILRGLLHFLEKTPLRALGLSQFWVLEKEAGEWG